MYNIVAPPRSVLQKDNVAIHFNTEERKIQEDMKNKIGEERFKKMQELRGKKDSLRHVKKLNNKATRKLKETIVQKGKKKWRSQSVKVMDSLSNEEKFVVRETINENTSTNTTVTNEMQKKESTSLLAKIKPYINANPQLNEVEDSRFSNKTKLELDIEKAIESKNYELAEKLSNQFFDDTFARQIAKAKVCKEYAEELENEGKNIPPRRRRKWNFDSKERWERRGNM